MSAEASRPGPDLAEAFRLAHGGADDLLAVPFALEEGRSADEELARAEERLGRLRELVALGPAMFLPLHPMPVLEAWERCRLDPDAYHASSAWVICRLCGDRVSPQDECKGARVRESADGSGVWAADAPLEVVVRDGGQLRAVHPRCSVTVPERFRFDVGDGCGEGGGG